MSNKGGFTLVELILVMVIIGILAGAVTLNFSGYVTDANKARVQQDLTAIESAIEIYAIRNNDQYPKALEDLMSGERKYLKELKPDPWDNPYVYDVPGKNGRPFELYSRGEDGQPGTADDISLYGDQATQPDE
jgi:general secretion pathway protein G